MFGTRWRLMRLFGIPLYLDLSWLLILALLTWTFTEMLPHWMAVYYRGVRYTEGDYWLSGFLTAVGFFICIVLHELGHAITAHSHDIPTRGITLFLFGGVAELSDEPASPWSEFLMAAAGPAVTVVLMLLLGIAASAGYRYGWQPLLVVALGYLAFVNAIVLVFNLIPAFPLDGGRILRSILWGITGNLARATRWAAGIGQLFGWAIIIWGVVQIFFGNLIGFIWLCLVGWFLGNAARNSYAQVVVQQALRGVTVRRFMTPNPITVAPNLSLREWVEDYVYRYHRKIFPVAAEGVLSGYVDATDLAQVPPSEWDIHTVEEEMHRDIRPIAIGPDDEAMAALKRMQQTGVSRLLVVEDGRLVGVLSLKDLLHYLELKMELEAHAPTRPAPSGQPPESIAPETQERNEKSER